MGTWQFNTKDGQKYEISAPNFERAEVEFDAQQAANQYESVQGEPGAGMLFQNQFSLGMMDKASGAAGFVGELVKGGSPKRGYQVHRRAQEILEERARESSGFGGTAAEVAGAVGTGTLAKAPMAATWLGRAAQAGKEGAILGGFQGAGESKGGLEGAVSGGLGGAALGGGLGAGLSSVVDAARAVPGALKSAGRGFNRLTEDPTGRAARMAVDALSADDVAPGLAVARLKRATKAGTPQTLADIAGENVQGLARASSAQPGPGRRIMNSFLDARDRGQYGRIGSKAANVFGDPDSYKKTVSDIATKRASDGKHLYGAAFSEGNPVDVMPVLRELDSEIAIARGGIKSSLTRARNLLVDKVKDRAGQAVEVPVADLEALHQAKMALDETLSKRVNSSLGSVSRGKIGKIRSELLNVMDDASPAYKAARSAYATDSALMDAADAGQDFMRMDAEDIVDHLKTMGSAERDMFRLGAMRELKRAMDRTPDAADIVKRIFGNPQKRAALNAVFPNQKSAREFMTMMTREAKNRGTYQFVRTGSRTSFVDAEKGASSAAGEALSAAADIGSGSPATSTVRAISKFLKGSRGMDPDVAEEVARILTQESPDAAMKLLGQARNVSPGISSAPRIGAGPAIRRALPLGGAMSIENDMIRR